jgi:hypothetical protein
MTKKIFFVLFLGIIILAGVLLLIPPGSGLIQSHVVPIPGSASIPTNTAVSGLSVAKGPAPQQTQSPTKTQTNATNEMPVLMMATSDRAERWRQIKKATAIEQQILELLNGNDLENPRFAFNLYASCLLAKGRQDRESFSRDNIRFMSKAYDTGMSEEAITKSFALSDNFAIRCGEAGGEKMRDIVSKAVQKARIAGSVLANAPYLSIENDTQLGALDKVLRSPELASEWLSGRRSIFKDAAANNGYLEGFNEREKNAVTWTVVCNLGGDCDDDGITRLNACISSDFCAGNSVAESIVDAVGENKMPLVAARANKIALELVTNGASFFKPRPK